MRRTQLMFIAVALAIMWIAGVDLSPLYGAPIIVGAVTGLPERAAMVQREMSQTITKFRPTKAKTLMTFEEGTRSKTGRMAGIQTTYLRDYSHGQTWYSPIANDNSFKRSLKERFGAMFIGLAYRNMNMTIEGHIQLDMKRGFIPDSYIKERRRRMETHVMKKNWAAIGDGTGAIAAVSSASGTTVTCLADNSAWGTSKGVFRLKMNDPTDPLLYDAINPATDAVVATFYVTAKPTSTTATVVFTVGNAAAMNVNTYKICETGSWKKEMNGIGGLVSDSTTRIFQGADVAVDEFLRNESVDAGNAVLTPTSIHTVKGVMMTKANNDTDYEYPYVGHISQINFRDLAKFGYTSRTYNADGGKANKTFGLPTQYEDGDTMWAPDADFEDCYVVLREKAPYFEYVQKKLGLWETDGIGRHEWDGLYGAGSTTAFENYNEAVNLGWDGRGKDGDGQEGGSPNTAVIIKNIALSANAQYAKGV